MRKAFGPQRSMSPIVKARNVAASICAHNLRLTPETWARYGLTDHPAQQALVRRALDDTIQDALVDYLAGRASP